MEPVIVINDSKLELDDILNNEKLTEHLFIDIDMAKDDDNYFKDGDYKKIELKVINTNNTYTLFHGFPGDNPVGCILLENDVIGIGIDFENDSLIPDIITINSWYIFMESNNFVEQYWTC